MELAKKKKEKVPQYSTSVTNIQTLNYSVYYMKWLEKILTFIFAFIICAVVGYIFYGGIGKNEFGLKTAITYVLDILIPGAAGIIGGLLFIPMRTKQIIKKRKKDLQSQFRDMLDALTTSLGSGKNVMDSFIAINSDLRIQYADDAYIMRELEVITSGLHNNNRIEDLLTDFGERSGIDDINSFASVFRVSYRKGGNIKEIIHNTHQILTDKMEIWESIETTVASNKMEQSIMVCVPILLVGAIKVMSPEFGEGFVSGAGLLSTTFAIGLFVLAGYAGKKILDIKV